MYQHARNSLVYNSSLTNVQGNFNVYIGHGGSHPSGLEVLYGHCAPDATHDSQKRSPPPRCHPETRLDILSILDGWAKDTDLPHIAWLYGAVGTGKSAVAQTMAERWIREGQVVVTFFFSRNSERRRVGRHIVPTLAYQLAMANRDVSDYIESVIRGNHALFTKVMSVQFQKLIVEPLRRLHSADLSGSIIFIVDGLNECEDEVQKEFLGIIRDFESFTDIACSVRFLITSRQDPQIRCLLQQSCCPITLDDCQDTYRDIRLYLENELANIYRTYTQGHNAPPLAQSWPSTAIINQLASNACGQFIYAFTVVRFVSDGHGSPCELLSLVLNPSIVVNSSSEGDQLFQPLDQLYLDILSRCCHPQLLNLVLGYIMASVQGLSLPQLSTLCACSTRHIIQVVHPLHSVLSIPDQSSPAELVSILHTSFSDFLENRRRSGLFFVNRSVYRAKLGVFFICNEVFSCDSCPIGGRNIAIGNYMPCVGLSHEIEPSAYHGVHLMIQAMSSWSEVQGIIASLGCTRSWHTLFILFLASLPSDPLVGGGWSSEDLTTLLFNTALAYPSDLQRIGQFLWSFISATSKLITLSTWDIRPNSLLTFLRDVRIIAYIFLTIFIATWWPLFLANLFGWLLLYLFHGIFPEAIIFIFNMLGRVMTIHRIFNFVRNTMTHTRVRQNRNMELCK